MAEDTIDQAEPHIRVRNWSGETISGGAPGLVERLPSGDVVKSPWPDSRAADCRRDMRTENQIYKRLGPHPRLVRMINWDPDECSLTMEYMSNGCLQDYLLAHNDKISTTQRLQWILEAAEGLQLSHSANILHCDVEPKNFLLDADLGLRIADFSGSSFEGSHASACASMRFLPPEFNLHRMPTVEDDLYGFGSTIYSIMAGQYPFQELPSDEVEGLCKDHEFPDVTGIPCGEIIERCRRCGFVSAQEIYDIIQAEILSCKIAIQ
ncbi:kinase-like domain-containing protein [Leptodontidium sp. MPI-SDFR-AT-0119]|nr:kinase-like domain-containing protein [Leptodontidium sp. MPI-SDFR-AT-0119]